MQILTQEQEILNTRQKFDSLVEFITQAAERKSTMDKVEPLLWERALDLGRSLLQGFVNMSGTGDVGETFDDQGGSWKRLPKLHTRHFNSVFGLINVPRTVYGTRETQKHEVIPLDVQLNLPASDFSYLLQNWDQALCVQNAYSKSCQTIKNILGLGQSVRSMEHMNRAMASGVESFHFSQTPPDPADEGPIAVVTADCKGVIMRGKPGEQKSDHRHENGELANRKKMACVGAAYTIDPFYRTAEDVVNALMRDEKEKQRPKPRNKRVRAELTRVIDGREVNGKHLLFEFLAMEMATRNPDGKKPVVCLMDGELALNKRRELHLSNTTFILDLYHVMERVWKCAHCLFKVGSDDAQDFVTDKLRRILHGKIGGVVGGIRQMATKKGLRGKVMNTLQKACRYMLNNREYMKYDEYLAAGYPIGSGVIEGACRHLVKDRMELAGMRWVTEGAQAMLDLRALYLNGEWDDFQSYRIKNESQRLYPERDKIMENLRAAA